jgi:hypothetical protein
MARIGTAEFGVRPVEKSKTDKFIFDLQHLLGRAKMSRWGARLWGTVKDQLV